MVQGAGDGPCAAGDGLFIELAQAPVVPVADDAGIVRRLLGGVLPDILIHRDGSGNGDIERPNIGLGHGDLNGKVTYLLNKPPDPLTFTA